MEPTMGKTNCKDCGAEFAFESIPFGKEDLGLALAKYCDGCEAAREAQQQRLERERQKEVYRSRVVAMLPPELLPVWLDPLGTDPEAVEFNRQKWEIVQRWRPGKHGNGLGLIGPAGTCKTRILALLAEKILMQGIRLKWTSAMRLHTEAAMNLRSRDRALTTTAREYFSECLSAAYLVIDDLGNNEWCPAFESQLFTILDHRKNYRLPVLWSANQDPEQFHLCITSVNPAALIGRLLDGTNTLDFTDHSLL
jgi:DNA replication protein DnaC